jgi:drug/metabolite transporter (DMT)-like permease
MSWFFIALINPLAHALVNHFDKYLISRFVKGSSVGVLIVFSSLFAVVALPVLFVINPNVFTQVTANQALILILNGALLMVAVLFYLYALEDDEASYVAPLFQLIPVFGFLFGYFILGEILTQSQLWAAALIVIGSMALTLELSGARPKIKSKVALLMVGSSVCYAANAVIFKLIAVEQGFTGSLFWDMGGKVLFGIFLLLTITSYREQFINLIRSTKYSLICLNMVNEVLGLIGEIALVLAVLFAPVALVQAVGGLQPLFVLVIGMILTLFFPRFGKETLTARHLTQKFISIGIITVGVYLLGA